VSLLRYVSSYSLLFRFCREVAPSATGDLEERSKDPQRVLGRVPADNTLWVHVIPFSVKWVWGLPAANNVHFICNLMQLYVHFSVGTLEADYQ